MVFRKQREKEFTCKVDFSIVYQMTMYANQVEVIGKREERADLLELGAKLKGLLEVAQGKVNTFDLTAYKMPEDGAAKIPDPRIANLKK